MCSWGRAMKYTKLIVCLANSRKQPGRCIAGKVWEGDDVGAWIRPISARQTHEISEKDRMYEDGKTSQVLDIVEIDFRSHSPHLHQTENHLIAEDYYWIKHGRADWNDLSGSLDKVSDSIWRNGQSTHHGCNDKVSEDYLEEQGSSLVLLNIPKLTLHVDLESGYQGQPARRRIRAIFDHAKHHYSLVVTDPNIEGVYFARPNGYYQLVNVIVCISLSEVIYGHAYKLVAAIFTEDICGK